MRYVKTLLIVVLLACGLAHAEALPGDAARLMPQLRVEIDQYWPGLTPRPFIPALIEQESLWKVGAKLKTSREFGCGLGQFTAAYDGAGRIRFDALEETKHLDASLAGWNWRNCSAERYQLRAVVLKLKANDRQCSILMADNHQSKACNAAMYNGGAGSISKRIRLCSVDDDCDVRQWFGHLERRCPQSRVKAAGYGEDFCTTNSQYPARVFARMPKYDGMLGP
jgi:hypothetical protein